MNSFSILFLSVDPFITIQQKYMHILLTNNRVRNDIREGSLIISHGGGGFLNLKMFLRGIK